MNTFTQRPLTRKLLYARHIPAKFNEARHCHDPVANDPNYPDQEACTQENPCQLALNSILNSDPGARNLLWAPRDANDKDIGTLLLEGELTRGLRLIMQLPSNIRVQQSFDVIDHPFPAEFRRKHNNSWCQAWEPTEQWAFRGLNPLNEKHQL